jgi:hypothetical protein
VIASSVLYVCRNELYVQLYTLRRRQACKICHWMSRLCEISLLHVLKHILKVTNQHIIRGSAPGFLHRNIFQNYICWLCWLLVEPKQETGCCLGSKKNLPPHHADYKDLCIGSTEDDPIHVHLLHADHDSQPTATFWRRRR